MTTIASNSNDSVKLEETSSSAPETTTANLPTGASKTYDENMEMTVVTEGSASILFPKGNEVFYNPVQQFNRDISTVAIRAWSNIYSQRMKELKNKKKLNKGKNKREASSPRASDSKKICLEDGESTEKTESATTEKTEKLTHTEESKSEESKEQTSATDTTKPTEEQSPKRFVEIIEALSASGLRAIRYASEIPTAKVVYANDFSESAVKSIKHNAEYSKVSSLIVPNQGDANMFMYTHKPAKENVHVVDLDPYGSATPFIDAALQCVKDDGLLLVTCTDLSVLAGNGYPEKCFAQYGGQTLYSDACHESALRLVLGMISNTAARYGMAIEPLLSLSIDFYVRLFIRVKKSPATVKFNAS